MGDDELNAIKPVFESGWLGMGSLVYDFEEKLKDFISAKNVVCTNTGTTALHLALESIGISKGDEVLVPSFTFISTIQAISATGAKPVFCDVRREDLNIDPSEIKNKITEKTKVIMPVHYRGLPCDMNIINKIASENNLRVIEDAAHAFGSSYDGKKIGSFSDIACFSFDPIKNITCGEGGAVVFQDDNLLEIIQQKRILGIDKDTWSRYKNERSWFYDVVTQGYRYHMSNINAAIGLVQIEKFKKMNERKIFAAKRYDAAFSNIKGITILRNDNYNDIGLFTYVMLIDNNRDKLMEYLNSKGVGCGVHYIPSHLFSYYKSDNVDLPVTEEIYEKIITLPLFPDITGGNIQRVIDVVCEGMKILNK
ncbi:DegT/DnrJ/EryC1/StrS family aminotransferase [Methanoplanus limicola]|uniref:DegT/DnrJ/EryC1/StrS family aminotransferase n=1 Tax=Methanoplanus limicola TaxID=2315 RepID=UPI000693B39C|nr:DegT/DnrJ/EryC1/StrS family aminotransferase [Methanoplanus limicola]